MTSGMKHMFLAAFFFSLMGLFVRLAKEIPFMEVVVFRAAVSFIISAVVLIKAGKPLFGKNKKLLTLRGIFGFGGLSAYFYTIHSMPLAEAVTIQYTNPLFTALFAPVILREPGTGREWIASVIAFAGVIFIANPRTLSVAFPAVVGLCGAMCSGIAYNIVRKLGIEGEDPLNIVLYFPFIALFLGVPMIIPEWKTPDFFQLLVLLGVGITTQLAQVSMTKGLKQERAAKATVMNYLVIFLSTLYSIFLGEQLDSYSGIGMGLIICGMLFLSGKPLRVNFFQHRQE